MIVEEIPPWLTSVLQEVNGIGTENETGTRVFPSSNPANHILLNEYKAGQGIMPHLDGDLFFPTISTLSLGSHTVLNFYHQMADGETANWQDRKEFSLLVEPRSLLILKDDLYHKFLHGIEEVEEDCTIEKNLVICEPEKLDMNKDRKARGTRYSLTMRNVPKTAKLKIKLW